MQRLGAFACGLALAMLFLASPVTPDTPANCLFEDVRGDWIFYETERNGDSSMECSRLGNAVYKKRVSLMYPNIAVDEYGNKGTWTMVYNQGFEVRVSGRSYFAFSFYEKHGKNVTSYCDKTFPGWSRDVTVRNWACFQGKKVDEVSPKVHQQKVTEIPEANYKLNKDFIKAINAKQNLWVAGIYPEYEEKTLGQMFKRAGGHKLSGGFRPKTARASPMMSLRSYLLPQEWDWRNMSGVSYVSPIRNQGNCGSCYAFASMAALESRVQILTRNELKPVFSPQDVVGCSKLSEGCEGGFPYLIAGRYAQDVGVVSDACAPYEGKDDVCHTNKKCARHYTAYYKYVGGYFGACNQEEMMMTLVRSGPVAVGIEVYHDFMHYKGGIYVHTGLKDSFNPLEETNHAVLVVGYGADLKTKEKYWVVKNSWGEAWGEDGYFRIRRGHDECAIESMAVEIVPIP